MLYDSIGQGYIAQRVTEPRIAAAIGRALEAADTVVNVGAGTGSYEPGDRQVVAIEPSMTMIRQRPVGAAPVIQAVAEQLPLGDKCVAAAMAVLTIHHWSEPYQGLRELVRIARDRVVVLTWDPCGPGFWLTDEYFPGIVVRDRERFLPVTELARALGRARVEPVMIPRDCLDGLLGAYWCRPQAYLEPAVRSAMSGFADLPDLDEGLSQLQRDLSDGSWQRRFGALAQQDCLDIGYRLITAQMH